jgi:hypothetical protein
LGCGIAVTDTDDDRTPDDNVNCPNDLDKTEPGICGCGLVVTDSDGDGIADCDEMKTPDSDDYTCFIYFQIVVIFF